MGNRIHGFLAGVLLTTSVAYYTSQEFKRSQEFVSKTLRDTESIIQNHGKEPQPVPRSVEFQYRPSIKQTVADLWNEQILSTVRSIYSFDVERFTSSITKSVQDGVNSISK
ncbi:hypothetical protein WICANDRAFT_65862 [Wickerhamomyces anomalus NRRL Y-366-8]|uniref:MICOS complex subunit MIC12 n=1 Tax=Wickerhamomyces anomalus (strain ATCC 58044 / CBS 1984 / NCYC 433 / NRRL Y-366-8) TaxID=683960 RepID=A0A1E3NUA6_WICAA|nr:uncharacterized protein WICANDRAFT_65862 [Wickerhamomyces anomalus NRRL Y-366-8]ODQ56663.1 hypothetical protein WICANDRAFT_65862 [Wickerhamomyces anomalus NRRL Y-366-8]